MKKIVFILIMSMLVIGCSNKVSNNYKVISEEEAYQMIYVDRKDLILLDVRTIEEYNESHLKDSINIPNNLISTKFKEENKDKVILTYCRSGARAKDAAQVLINMGYKNVYTFGGIIDFNYPDVIVK